MYRWPTVVCQSGHTISIAKARAPARSRMITNPILGSIRVNDEPWIHRITSHDVPSQEDAFRDGIRTRGGGCVITGTVNLSAPYDRTMFEAAHIFPPEKGDLWIEWGYGQWISDMGDTAGVSKISSCQNGFPPRADTHRGFGQYLFSINPDDNYKVVVFTTD
ncbi:unnamed protein product [Tuber aestivum]|uniref:HNH nuclease domain-containing protein n=1 Tax=Tuber aestivum TaxID=59557 RepID=A0A292PKF0_9PEZI|nr:unnamed protein product [Tuber aestivum]